MQGVQVSRVVDRSERLDVGAGDRETAQDARPAGSRSIPDRDSMPAGTTAVLGTSPPPLATAQSSATHVIVASVTCTQTMSDGRWSSYWTLPTSPWAASSRQK